MLMLLMVRMGRRIRVGRIHGGIGGWMGRVSLVLMHRQRGRQGLHSIRGICWRHGLSVRG